MSTFFRLYLWLAAASFAAALSWQILLPAVGKPDAIALHFYRHVLGELDGRSCPAYPVCSSYAFEAIEKHGLLVGSWLAMDRVIHEGDDLFVGQWVTVAGEQRLYDPLQRNDFWIKGE